jgi:signal transduction histidine kinase
MCDRLEIQIGDLLTYYRVGRMSPSVARVDLTAVVDAQVAALRPMLERRHGAVRVRGPLPAVDGHPVLLGMVFGNLIANGLKYNRSARPVVEIGLVAADPSTIYVRDNGIGIAEEHHEAIFAMFRRLHGRKEYEGSGAGLAIVRKIIDAYGGRIWLESEPGRGSTFFFSLPRGVAERPQPPHWGRSGVSQGAAPRRHTSPKR